MGLKITNDLVRSQFIPHKIYGGGCGTGTFSYPSRSALPLIRIFILIYLLLSPERQKDEEWEPSEEQCYSRNRRSLDSQVLYLALKVSVIFVSLVQLVYDHKITV